LVDLALRGLAHAALGAILAGLIWTAGSAASPRSAAIRRSPTRWFSAASCDRPTYHSRRYDAYFAVTRAREPPPRSFRLVYENAHFALSRIRS
jgi:hypothetical protein